MMQCVKHIKTTLKNIIFLSLQHHHQQPGTTHGLETSLPNGMLRAANRQWEKGPKGMVVSAKCREGGCNYVTSSASQKILSNYVTESGKMQHFADSIKIEVLLLFILASIMS